MENENEKELRKIITLMQRDDSVDAPEEAIRWAKNLFLTRAAEPRTPLVEKVLAVLLVSLAPDRTAFGERSAGAVRQMLFSAGAAHIDLRIVRGEPGFSLTGQILGEDLAEAMINLVGDEQSYATRAGQLSEFKFTGVEGGHYRLILQKGGKEIIIEDLEIS